VTSSEHFQKGRVCFVCPEFKPLYFERKFASEERGNKSSAAAEMDDRVRAKWAEKCGAAVPLSGGELGSHLTQCRLGRGLPALYEVTS